MSNFTFMAKNKLTGEFVSVGAYDNYFGRHQYGYAVKNEILNSEDFDKIYEDLKEDNS